MTPSLTLESPRKRMRARRPAAPLMHAAAIDRFGPPSVLKVRSMTAPTPGPNEILIAVHSAGVGIWDTEIRHGWWPEGKPKFPLVLGVDGAGIVVAKGSRVRRFSDGDLVWAYEFINPKGGFYSEYVAVDARRAGRIPTQLVVTKQRGGSTVAVGRSHA